MKEWNGWVLGSTTSADRSTCDAVAICILLIAPISTTEAVEWASSKQCSNPAFVFETFRTDELPSTRQTSLRILSDDIAQASALAISSPCGQYLIDFRGSTFTFSTGVEIGPNRASNGLEARKIRFPLGQTLPKLEYHGIYSGEKRIATAGDGTSVDLVFSSGAGHSEVSIVTSGSSRAAHQSVLLKSDTTIRSADWIGSVHGGHGGLYILEEGSGLIGHTYTLQLKPPLGKAKL